MDIKIEVAKVLNDVLMEELERPKPFLEGDAIVTINGRFKDVGWPVSIVVRADEHSVSFSVQLPGYGGYMTDILTQFVNEDTIRQYAEHVHSRILTKNDIPVEGYVKS
jgi:hypothetical protein